MSLMSDHPEVVVAHPGMLVIIIADALPAGQPQLLVGYDGKQPSVLGTPVAGSQVLQDCHQQGSVEAVPISCKVTLLLSALKVVCMACILQFVGCWQPGPQDCHQQGSVEAVAIPGKVTLLFSAPKVLCMVCILQFVGCWQQGPPRLPPARLCRSSCHLLQGGIVVVSTEGTL